MKKSKYRAKGGGMKGTKYRAKGGGMKGTKYMSVGGALKSEMKANPGMGNIPASVKKALAGSAIGFGVGSKNLLRANKAKKSSL
jgi:hypothetical protein